MKLEEIVELKLKKNKLIIPNPLTLEGVNHLLKLNTFNELPNRLYQVAPLLVEYYLISDVSTYSKEIKREYNKNATKLIDRIINLYDFLNYDLKTSKRPLDVSIKMYIQCLAKNIGKSKEYKHYYIY